MAEGRTKIGRWAAIAVSLMLAALLYAVPAVAADGVDTGSADSNTPIVISQQGVEWTDVVRNPRGALRRGPGRTVLGVEWTD
jgi:hypothetical protein